MSENSEQKDFQYDVGQLTEKAKKVLNKFTKRKLQEMKKNTNSEDFKFVALNNQYWYFEFEVQSGMYKGQRHIIETKLVFGKSPNIYVYPMNAPKCTFITPIWHPNISDKGTICLDVLKDNWSPSMFTATILSALKLLLEEPNTASPLNRQAAKMIKKDLDEYKKYVKSYYDYEKAPSSVRQLFNISTPKDKDSSLLTA